MRRVAERADVRFVRRMRLVRAASDATSPTSVKVTSAVTLHEGMLAVISVGETPRRPATTVVLREGAASGDTALASTGWVAVNEVRC